MPILSVGAKAVWADIDPRTGTLSPDSVRKKLTAATKAIFHNHHCGYPGYIDEINTIGKEKGLPVIDDCIEAFGARYKGRALGSLDTDVTLFSFQTVRLPNTIDGGAVCFRDIELHEKACKLRDLGVDRSTFRDDMGEISPLSDVRQPGMGVTMKLYRLHADAAYRLAVSHPAKKRAEMAVRTNRRTVLSTARTFGNRT